MLLIIASLDVKGVSWIRNKSDDPLMDLYNLHDSRSLLKSDLDCKASYYSTSLRYLARSKNASTLSR